MSDPRPAGEKGAVLGQLGRRRLFLAGVGTLVLLYGVAIFAPLLANDRPVCFSGINLRAYRTAGLSMSGVLASLDRRNQQSDAEYRAELQEAGSLGRAGVPQRREQARQQELGALRVRLEVMRRYLPADGPEPGPRAKLLALEANVVRAIELGDAGQASSAGAVLSQAKTSARQLARELAPLDPSSAAGGGVDLVARRSYPLVDALAGLDVFFMAFYVLGLGAGAWALIAGLRRKTVWRAGLAAVVCSAALAVAFTARFGPGENMHSNAVYKTGLINGDLVSMPAGKTLAEGGAANVLWAPLPYGVAEGHAEEPLRPPTWRRSAAVDAEGRYIAKRFELDRGLEPGLAPQVEGEVFTPIQVRAGEPSRNAWQRHLAGTDGQGRDVLTRLIWGARTSLSVGLLSASLLTVIGVLLGSLAGYFGGWVDLVILRLIEILQSIPAFFLILMTMAFLPQGSISPIFAIVIVIALVRWTGTARLVRAEFLRLRNAEFVLAARALGYSHGRIVWRHILPNALGPVVVSAAFAVAVGILTESAVSFLGFGIRAPETSWGELINGSRTPSHWWIQFFPGLLIFITVTCYNLVGDGLRDALDPRLERE